MCTTESGMFVAIISTFDNNLRAQTSDEGPHAQMHADR